MQPSKFIRETDAFYVLADMPSESNPAKSYELRTSKRDGKTYCVCPAWIHKARKGDGICKHIAAFNRTVPVPVVVYNFDEFVKVKRGIHLICDTKSVESEVKVRRA